MTVRGDTATDTADSNVRFLVERDVLGTGALHAAHSEDRTAEVATPPSTAGRVLAEAVRNEPRLGAV